MNYIAFKQLKDHKLHSAVGDLIPSELIVEIQQYNKDLHKTSDGYQIVNESDFEKEINKNRELVAKIIKDKAATEEAHKKYLMQEFEAERQKNHKEYKLWLEFNEWKANQEKVKAELEKERIQKIWNERTGLTKAPYKEKEV